jgi:hypothetical protein
MEPDSVAESVPTSSVRQWTILRIMVIIALLAPLLALTRYPFVFGLVAFVGSIALFVGLSLRRQRYDLIAWLLVFYPVLPLLILHVHWRLAIRKIVSRADPLFGGLIGLSDIGGFLGLFAYMGCVAILARALGKDRPKLRRAAWLVVILMPIAWSALFVFAIRDPFGCLQYMIRF